MLSGEEIHVNAIYLYFLFYFLFFIFSCIFFWFWKEMIDDSATKVVRPRFLLCPVCPHWYGRAAGKKNIYTCNATIIKKGFKAPAAAVTHFNQSFVLLYVDTYIHYLAGQCASLLLHPSCVVLHNCCTVNYWITLPCLMSKIEVTKSNKSPSPNQDLDERDFLVLERSGIK